MVETPAPNPAPADPKPGDQNPANPPAPTGPEPAPKPGEGNPAFDPSKLSDEDFTKLFEDNRLYRNPRFKSLSERAKKADDLEKAASDAETQRLADEGKYKEIADKKTAEAEAANKTVQDLRLNSNIQIEASKLGVVDLEAVLLLINRENIKVDETSGAVSGVEDAVKALLEAKPYLKGTPTNPPAVGGGSNPSPGETAPGAQKFKLSQIQDAVFFKEHEADINAALKAGLIENDIGIHA